MVVTGDLWYTLMAALILVLVFHSKLHSDGQVAKCLEYLKVALISA